MVIKLKTYVNSAGTAIIKSLPILNIWVSTTVGCQAYGALIYITTEEKIAIKTVNYCYILLTKARFFLLVD